MGFSHFDPQVLLSPLKVNISLIQGHPVGKRQFAPDPLLERAPKLSGIVILVHRHTTALRFGLATPLSMEGQPGQI